jgi:predicted metalloprotease with PDZ domain
MAIKFIVDLSSAHTHVLKVKMEFPSSGKEELVMPVWAPGSYLVRDFSRHIIRYESNGKVTQLSKNRWSLETSETVAEFYYEIYSDELTVETSYADQSVILINGTSLFFYLEGRKEEEISVKFSNVGDKKISTGLPDRNVEFIAENYDQLADSPFLIGSQKIMEFDAMNRKHIIAWSGNLPRDEERIIDDFKKIVTEEGKIFGELPYNKYVFMIITVPDEYYGGLEHKNSTVILHNEQKSIDEFGYKLFLTTVSHEFFHTWNVKRIRPVELGPFDYTKEVYTKLLWLSEGFTSYYEWVVLWRSGIVSEQEYFDHLGKMIDFYELQPGHRNISADASSFNTWIKLYKPDGDAMNSYISYYLKGELVAFALNCEIMKCTNDQRSLDDLFRSLYNEYKRTGKGIEKADLIEHARKVSCDGIGKIVTKLTESTEDIEFEKYLKYLGYRVDKVLPEKREKARGFLGLTFQTNGGKTVVRSSIKGYPAYEAGVVPGDEIIAINGERFTDTFTREMSKEIWRVKLDDLKKTSPGDRVNLFIFRMNRLLELGMTAAEELRERALVKENESKAKDKLMKG